MGERGRVVLVTGGGSGIGRATAYRFASDGASVVVADIDPASAEDTAATVRDRGHEAVAIRCDVAARPDCEAAVRRTVTRYGGLDVLVANAGVQQGGRLEDVSEEDIQRVLAVNLIGVANSARAAIGPMTAGGGGAMVLVSSVNALRASPDMAAYDMAKAGVLALTRTLAVAHGRDGIRVNAICPGNTITDIHLRAAAARGRTAEDLRAAMSGYGALGRAAEPDEIAAAIAFLAGPDASFVTGHTLVADGGATIGLR